MIIETQIGHRHQIKADWLGNINYGSPSNNHELGVSLSKVRTRQASTQYMSAGAMNFAHGVASGDPIEDSLDQY